MGRNGPRGRVERLQRRLKYLKERIRVGELLGRDMHHDNGEVSALVWVLEVVKEHNPEIFIT